MAQERDDSQRDENGAKRDAHAVAELDQQAEKMQAEEKNQRASDGGERAAMLVEETADGAGGGSERDEDRGEADDEGERGREKARARDLALSQLLHADAAEHGDVTGNKWQHARGKERDQTGKESASERDVGHRAPRACKTKWQTV